MSNPTTDAKGRLPKDRGEALCILEMWAERKDVQNMGWGWPEWRGMNPSFAAELLACVALLKEQPAEPSGSLRPGLERAIEIVSASKPRSEYVNAEGYRDQLVDMLDAAICPAPTKVEKDHG